mgnify:CR=1 FL=1
MHLVMPTLPYSPTHLKKTDLNRAVPLCILLLFCAFLQEKRGYPTTPNQILHPILHPKSLVNTGYLRHGCRKCRLFFKNFFCGKRNNGDFILRVLGIIKASIASLSLNDNSAEDAKHRTSLGKSTDVLHRKYGCLPQRSPMFLISEKGKVLNTDLSDFTDFTLRAN